MVDEASDAGGLLLVVAAALVNGAGQVLMQRRPPGKAHAGLWEFPGGKVEPGECPTAALVRELREELGIEVAEEALARATFAEGTLPGRHLVLLLYVIRAWRGEPRAIEASALTWRTPSELASLPMPPADVPLVAWLERSL